MYWCQQLLTSFGHPVGWSATSQEPSELFQEERRKEYQETPGPVAGGAAVP